MPESKGVQRPNISEHQIRDAFVSVSVSLEKQMQSKGRGAFLSVHEILGVLVEECGKELVEAVHSNIPERVRAELIDIAVAALFGIACIDAKVL